MKVKVQALRGMPPDTAAALQAQGIYDSEQLLAAAGEAKNRAALAQKLHLDSRQLLELTNRADLARIKGIGRVYSDLLEQAGVDTVSELRQRKPENLLAKLQEVGPLHQVRRIPRLADVQAWIEQAQRLERKVHY